MLADAGVTITTRRIEGWTQDQLDADGEESLSEQTKRYRILAKVSGGGRGRSADVTALRLAANGVSSRRLRAALLRAASISNARDASRLIDFSTEESTDEAFRRLERFAKELNTSVETYPLPMRHVLKKFQRNARRAAAQSDESGETIFVTAIVNLMCPLFGGELFDFGAVASLMGLDPTELDTDAIEDVIQRLRFDESELVETYRTAPLERIVVMAKWLRGQIREVAHFVGLETATDPQLEELVAVIAPYALYLMTLVSERLNDGPEILASMNLPAELFPTQPAA
jgi:hypothetical protein